MTIQKIAQPLVDKTAEAIYVDCYYKGLPNYHNLKEVLNELVLEAVNDYCDTVKEKK